MNYRDGIKIYISGTHGTAYHGTLVDFK
jgi:hypothetical protein